MSTNFSGFALIKARSIQTSGAVSNGPPVCPETPLAEPGAVISRRHSGQTQGRTSGSKRNDSVSEDVDVVQKVFFLLAAELLVSEAAISVKNVEISSTTHL